jgi:uncharacterized protein YeaO (DUF488 family)
MGGVTVEVRRVYDDPMGRGGEHRVLVDRLWPRGLAKRDLRLDRWAKELAPSTELRKWYGHDPERFPEFARRYRQELAAAEAKEAAAELLEAGARGPLVLLTATKDVERSGAKVLAERLRRCGALRR